MLIVPISTDAAFSVLIADFQHLQIICLPENVVSIDSLAFF